MGIKYVDFVSFSYKRIPALCYVGVHTTGPIGTFASEYMEGLDNQHTDISHFHSYGGIQR